MMKLLLKLFPRIGVLVLVPMLALSAIMLNAQEVTPEATPPTEATTVAEPTESPAATELPTEAPTEDVVVTEEPSVTPDITEEATQIPVTPDVTEAPSTEIAPEPPFSLLVREMFDNGDLSPWTLTAGWSLVPSETGQALQVLNSTEPIELLKGSFYNVAVQASFLSDSGDAVLSVRNSEVGRYSASLSPDGTVELYRGDAVVAATLVPVSTLGQWRILRISAADAVIRIAVDNLEVLVYEDSASLPPGTIQLSAHFDNPEGSNTLLMDDFFLWVPADELVNYPAPTPYSLPPVVTPEAPVETETAATAMPSEVASTVKDYSPFPPPTAEQLNQAQLMSTLGNDNFDGIEITSLPYMVSDNTIGDSVEVSEPHPTCGISGNHTVWFKFTPVASGSYRFSSAGSDFDTILALYTGSSLNTLAQVTCNDDISATDLDSQFTVNLNAGTSYYLQLDGFNGRYGNYNLVVQLLGLAAPTVPSLLLPAQATKTNDTTPNLSWTTALNVAQYELQWATNATFTANLQKAFITEPATSYDLPSLNNTNATVYYWRVRAINGSGVAGAFSAVRNFTLDTTPPNIPNLTAPANGAVTTNSRPVLTWGAATGASSYEIVFDNDNDFSSPSFIANPNGTSYTLNTQPQGTYYWRVRARDAAGNYSAASAERSITIKILSSPANNAVIFTNTGDTNAVLRWVAVAGVTSYRVQIDDDTDFSADLVHEATLGNVTTYTTALTTGIYYWQVVPIGYEQTTSVYNTLTVSPPALAAPTILAPANAFKTNDISPDLFWDNVAGAAFYEIQWATNSSFTANVQSLQVSDPTNFINLPDLPVTNSTVYYWRMRTINSLGVAGAYSAARNFTLDTSAPAVPNLNMLANNATTTDSSPTLSWSAVNGATSYILEISVDENFGSFVVNSEVIGTNFTPSNSIPQGVYYWRVRARDAAANESDNPATRSFTIKILSSPANNAVIITSTGDAAPVLQWVAVAGATGYVVQIDDDSDFSADLLVEEPIGLVTSYTVATPLVRDNYYWQVIPVSVEPTSAVYNQFTISEPLLAAPSLLSPNNAFRTNDNTPNLGWDVVADAHIYEIQWATNSSFTANVQVVISMTTSTDLPALPVATGTTYYWRVRSLNQWGAAGAYSAARTFILDTTVPNAPNLTAPANAANLSNSRPAFTWQAATGATSYRLDVDDDSDFSSPILDNFIVNGTSYTPPSSLAQAVYYWRVQAVDAAGNLSDESVTRSFTLKILLSPANNAVITATSGTASPVLRWAAVAGATGYTIQIDDDGNAGNGLVVDVTLTNVTTYTVSPALATGTYNWQVIPTGFEQDDPAYNYFTISPGVLAAPSLLSPTQAAKTNDTTPELSWSAVTNAYEYEVQWATNSSFTVNMHTEIVTAPTTSHALPTLPDTASTVYYWRVRTINQFGVAGSYSAARNFTLDTVVPNIPVLVSPANGSTSTVNPVQFRWNASAGAFRYEIRYGLVNPPNITVTNLATTSYTPSPLLLQNYYWQVRAVDAAGNVSDWTAIREVKILSGTTAAPLPNLYGDNTPTLAWTPISWTSSGGYYQIQVDNNNTFGSPEYINNNVSSASPSVETSALLDGVWYWRVRACNSANVCGAWSTTGIFTIIAE